jgi:nicotinate phosphoribosyltransferase
MDFAGRAHDHNYKLDPIIRRRDDIDFYKIPMLQLIHEKHPMTEVSWEVTNRTTSVRLADIVSPEEVREQLDHARSLHWEKSALINLRGQTYYGKEGMFSPAFVSSLGTSKLPDYELTVDKEAGQFGLRTHGTWFASSPWETAFTAVLNELRSRAVMRTMSKSALDIMYARAKVKLYAKLERLKERPELLVSDFGTRRRHSFLWQEWAMLTACEVLGPQFVGTSNVFLAHKHGLEAKGTNAHELPMVYAALAAGKGPEALRESQYQVLRDWHHMYGTYLQVFLPDTFGTTQFLENFPADLLPQIWTGYRPDSKEPFEAGEEAIAFWRHVGAAPAKKLCLFADGLDVEIPGFKPNGTDMIALHDRFHGRITDSYGWGTTLTNDFVGCPVGDPLALKPLSLVCKVASANGRAAVKISDNPSKARSPDPSELAYYLETFGHAGVGAARETLV